MSLGVAAPGNSSWSRPDRTDLARWAVHAAARTRRLCDIAAARIAQSMGAVGSCFGNAVAESFFATLKKELVHRSTWPTRRELTSEVFEYIEGFYNRIRRHSRLGMLSPADYEHVHAPLAGAREKSVHDPSGCTQHDDDNH